MLARVLRMAQPYAVRLDTGYGALYVRYPAAAEPLAVVLAIGSDGVQATAVTFDRAGVEQMLASLVPEAVRVTVANNLLGWIRANPWH